METDIFTHIKIIIYEILSLKMTKQHIFIIENNLQKVGQSFFHMSRRTTVIQDLLVRRSFHWYRTIGQTLMSRPRPTLTNNPLYIKYG